jgi:hypothetical protein
MDRCRMDGWMDRRTDGWIQGGREVNCILRVGPSSWLDLKIWMCLEKLKLLHFPHGQNYLPDLVPFQTLLTDSGSEL